MAFSVISKKTGAQYFLHHRKVTLNGGRQQVIYFFAKEKREADVLQSLPSGYEVVENVRTGLPLLKRKVAA